MKKLVILLFIFSGVALAQIPAGYYNSAQGLTGNALKTALYNIIKNHTQVSYANLWNAYKKTDIKPNGKVWDIYSDVPSGTPPYQFTFVTDQCGNYSVEGDCYNREHSWPQSWFNSVAGPVSDLFHIYPTDGKVNGMRSNYPYGNVSTASWTSLNGGKLGACSDPGYNMTVFEPIDDYKGDLARTYFYMSTRYYTEDNGWASSDATNKADILPWEVNVLLQWHHQDPVSAKEIARNDSIYYRFQNNRNPFIDHPQWADSIWHTTNVTFLKEQSGQASFSIYPNPASESFTILKKSFKNSSFCRIQVFDICGNLTEDRTSSSQAEVFDCSSWKTGVYLISIESDKQYMHFRFVKL